MKITNMKVKKLVFILILLTASFLRLYKLHEVPPSLFGDELDVGYHAYSILKTGKDYYGNSWPLHFHSLAEWRTPLYLYSAVPTVAVFGISPYGVRLPAAIFGILGILGMYFLINELGKLISSKKKTADKYYLLSIISSFVLAINPWHIQYSRGGFEVTMLTSFIIWGLYFFFYSLQKENKGKYLWLSVSLLVLTPLIYSSAKLFMPLFMLLLFILFKKHVFRIKKVYLFYAILAGLVLGLPTAYATLFSGGTQRFSHISIFTDPAIRSDIGFERQHDALKREDVVLGLQPSVIDKLYHNKFVSWSDRVVHNFVKSFSTEFLFLDGDPNLRHSVPGVGQFYRVELIAFFIGLIYFFVRSKNRRIKTLIAGWIILGAFTSALTRNGGNHATRLILMLPPLTFLISYGIYMLSSFVRTRFFLGTLIIGSYLVILSFNFVSYQHQYWIHYPWDSEKWWHSGFSETVTKVKAVEDDFEKVIFSMKGEPAWIFFAAHYEYPPDKWQKNFPIGNDTNVGGFGKVSHINKYYFGSPKDPETGEDIGVYDWGKILDSKTLYVAPREEVNLNLILEPERMPTDLVLVDKIAYPSGEPAFYIFSGK